MKTFFTLPTDKDFFNRYARLIPALKVSGYFGQVVSGLTEIGAIYAAIYASLLFFSEQHAATGAIFGAIVGTAIIEIGLRVLLPYSARAVLYKRFKGLDLVISIIVLIACAVLLSLGTLMSFHGSRDIVDNLKPEPKLKSSQADETRYSQVQQAAFDQFRQDSAEITGRYSNQIAATKAQYSTQAEQHKGALNALERREKAGQSFSTAKGQARAKVAQIEAEQAAKLAELTAAQGREMGQAVQRRNKATNQASQELNQAKNKIEGENSKLVSDGENKLKRYKGGFSYFTLICHLILLVSIFVDEVHKKGSGIEQKVLPTQYDFSDSIGGELWHALSSKANQYIRERIRRIEESTPPPPLPISPNELFALDNLNQPVYSVDFEQLPAAYQNVRIAARAPIQQLAAPGTIAAALATASPIAAQGASQATGNAEQMAFQYLKAAIQLAASGLEDAAQEMRLKAEQVLQMYLGKDASAANVETLKRQCIDHLEGRAENPFSHHHRKPIGFASASSGKPAQGDTNAMRYSASPSAATEASPGAQNPIVLDASMKACENCGTSYKPRTTWQKFCSDACRESHHEARHDGQKFKPGEYRKAKGPKGRK
jgi:hypothetical protein